MFSLLRLIRIPSIEQKCGYLAVRYIPKVFAETSAARYTVVCYHVIGSRLDCSNYGSCALMEARRIASAATVIFVVQMCLYLPW